MVAAIFAIIFLIIKFDDREYVEDHIGKFIIVYFSIFIFIDFPLFYYLHNNGGIINILRTW